MVIIVALPPKTERRLEEESPWRSSNRRGRAHWDSIHQTNARRSSLSRPGPGFSRSLLNMADQSAPGWHSDPFRRFDLRYWDGQRWTDHVAYPGFQGTDPAQLVAPPSHSSPPPPAQWHSDPLKRFDRRYWDGQRWTEHVANPGFQGVDPPVAPGPTTSDALPQEVAEGTHVTPTGTTSPPTSKKIARQARQAGATSRTAGGGTLFTESTLVVNQKARIRRGSVAYDVHDRDGRKLGSFRELRRDLNTLVTDRIKRSRTTRYEVADAHGKVMYGLTRPERWNTFRAAVIVDTADGRNVGQITHESFGVGGMALEAGAAAGALAAITTLGPMKLLAAGLAGSAAAAAGGERLEKTVNRLSKAGHARFGLEAHGQRLGSIHATNTRQWDFVISGADGTEIGKITKTWAGWAKERFTKADHYVVQMDEDLAEPLRTLVVTAALAVDVALKQDRPSHKSGILSTRRFD